MTCEIKDCHHWYGSLVASWCNMRCVGLLLFQPLATLPPEERMQKTAKTFLKMHGPWSAFPETIRVFAIWKLTWLYRCIWTVGCIIVRISSSFCDYGWMYLNDFECTRKLNSLQTGKSPWYARYCKSKRQFSVAMYRVFEIVGRRILILDWSSKWIARYNICGVSPGFFPPLCNCSPYLYYIYIPISYPTVYYIYTIV